MRYLRGQIVEGKCGDETHYCLRDKHSYMHEVWVSWRGRFSQSVQAPVLLNNDSFISHSVERSRAAPKP
jgi:hypothetical protein